MHLDLQSRGLELARAIDAHQYEKTDNGIYFPRKRLLVAGLFRTWVNGRDEQVDPNVVPAEGIALILKSGLTGQTYYVSPFLNDLDPPTNLTAATFDSTMNEFTAYDETTRQAWTIPTDPVAGVFSNSASPAVFTAASSVGTGAGVDVYGAAIIGASGKEATTNKIVCCSRFGGARNLKTGDKLTIQYDLSGTSVT